MLGRYIDLGNPVSDHPLNRGLVSWWLPLPSNAGGGTLFDIAGRNHGTLTNGPTWTSGPNGFDALSFDGSNDYALIAQGDNSLNINGPITMYARLRTGGGATRNIIGAYELGGSFAGYAMGLGQTGTSGSISYWNGSSWVGASTSVADSLWHSVAITANASGSAFYLDGKADGTSGNTSPGSYTGTRTIGARQDGAGTFPGSIAEVRIHTRALSASEIYGLYEQSLRGHPDTLRRFSRKAYLFGSAAGGGGSPISVTPTTLALALTAYAPTVLAPRLVTPSTASLALTTFAPSALAPRTATPTTRALTLTAYAPTIVNPKSATPSTLALSLTTYAPTAAAPRVCTPTTASLTLTAYAPTVLTPRTCTPSTLALSITANAPTVQTPRTATPATKALAITTFAPTVSTPRICTPTTLSLSLAAFAPTVAAGRLVTPSTLALTLATYAPTVPATANVRCTPSTLALVLATYAPVVNGDAAAAGSIRLEWQSPSWAGTWRSPDWPGEWESPSWPGEWES